MQQSLEAETRAMFEYPVAVYEHTLTPQQTIRMHYRALPWFPDTLAITQLLGARPVLRSALSEHVASMRGTPMARGAASRL